MSAMFLRSWLLLLVVAVGLSWFLLILPSTGMDYDYYKDAYDNAFGLASFPWFDTQAIITAEPLYLWYSSFFSVVTGAPFQFFLALNFLICFFFSVLSFRENRLLKLDLAWVAFLPVIAPTLFYFSPRSSLSFFMLMFGFFLLVKGRFWVALPVIVFSMMFHSQYILIGFFIIFSYLIFEVSPRLKIKKSYIAVLVVTGMAIFLLGANYLVGFLASFFSVVPNSDVAVGKLSQLENVREGYRVTAMLSVLVYPALLFFVWRRAKSKELVFYNDDVVNRRWMFMIAMAVVFGAMVNLVFFNASHLSGRLGRFSDYFSMAVLVPLSLRLIGGRLAVSGALLILVIMAPFMYSTVYNI
tara:strand:- start:526 stop:1590 length:1065 start_codon:yes stop_codon:yes gene_type:complete